MDNTLAALAVKWLRKKIQRPQRSAQMRGSGFTIKVWKRLTLEEAQFLVEYVDRHTTQEECISLLQEAWKAIFMHRGWSPKSVVRKDSNRVWFAHRTLHQHKRTS
jgi:hypothetical protein